MHPGELTRLAQSGRMISGREIAALFGKSQDWWWRNKRRLIARHSFPGPVDGTANRWDREAIVAWLDRQLPAAARPPAPQDDDDPELRAWAEKLDGRAANLTVGE